MSLKIKELREAGYKIEFPREGFAQIDIGGESLVDVSRIDFGEGVDFTNKEWSKLEKFRVSVDCPIHDNSLAIMLGEPILFSLKHRINATFQGEVSKTKFLQEVVNQVDRVLKIRRRQMADSELKGTRREEAFNQSIASKLEDDRLDEWMGDFIKQESEFGAVAIEVLLARVMASYRRTKDGSKNEERQ